MTKDDITRIYSQVSEELCGGKEWCWAGVSEPLQRFANLVAAAEREACAELCEYLPADEFVERSEATIWDVATLDCAAAIRARREQ